MFIFINSFKRVLFKSISIQIDFVDLDACKQLFVGFFGDLNRDLNE